MYEFDDDIEQTDVPEEFRAVAESIRRFVDINYETARTMTTYMKVAPADIAQYKGKVLDIIRNNPPLASVPRYFRDGREDYLWYSDFYDEVTKEVYHAYRKFVNPINEITPGNYAEELAKIDLPYFKELINLVSLERLCLDYEKKKSNAITEIKVTDEINQVEEKLPTEEISVAESPEPKPNSKRLLGKRSYEPKLTDKQYALLAECIETIKLFRRRVKVTELKKLLKGKLPEPLQITNQKSLVYLLDLLKENKYIKETWMSVAEGNKDFISFRSEGNERRYGSEPHFITMQQFLNNRRRSQREAIYGLDAIEDTIDLMEEYRDK